MTILHTNTDLKFLHKKIYLIRHGETEWTLSGQHTGRTDIPLTPKGKAQAALVGKCLKNCSFQAILSSPLKRARQTCEIAGLLERARLEADLVEWDYGKYEGLTTEEIRQKDPQWNLFSNGAPQGESISEVSSRADQVLSRLQSLPGDIALFSHGHFLRVLAARWLQLPANQGNLFTLFPSSISILGFEHDRQVIILWNNISHLQRDF